VALVSKTQAAGMLPPGEHAPGAHEFDAAKAKSKPQDGFFEFEMPQKPVQVQPPPHIETLLIAGYVFMPFSLRQHSACLR
jgi:hypothetical protein